MTWKPQPFRLGLPGRSGSAAWGRYPGSGRVHVPERMAPASSWCPQLWTDRPRWWHCPRLLSWPVQHTSSRKMGPEPPPNRLPLGATRACPQPSCPHTTCAVGRPQRWSHPDPQGPQEPCVDHSLPTGLSVLPLRVGGWLAVLEKVPTWGQPTLSPACL